MICSIGLRLRHQLEKAQENRMASHINRLHTPKRHANRNPDLDIMREFDQALSAWLSHRAFCLDCREVTLSDPNLSLT